MVAKTWDLHVKDVLRCSLDENLTICSESVEYLKKHGLEVIFDAEHFFDGYKNNPEFAMKVLEAGANAGANVLALCETNGGCMPIEVYEITKKVCERFGNLTSEFTLTMTQTALPQTVSRLYVREQGKCREL